jgi:large subunit ribosomal protein L28
MSGNLVSHSNRKTRTSWAPNIQRKTFVVNGTVKKVNICTRCYRSIRSGKMEIC